MEALEDIARPGMALRFLIRHLSNGWELLLQGRRRSDTRARKLLLGHLSPQQRESLLEHGYFTVQGNHTGDTYEVWAGVSYNVVRMRDGVHFCFEPHIPKVRLPLADIMLGQALLLRHAEDHVLRLVAKGGMIGPTRRVRAA